MKKRYKIVLAYDGTHYSGYQLQSNGIAVQQRLEEVLEYLNRAPVRVFGSSRTDAGVHDIHATRRGNTENTEKRQQKNENLLHDRRIGFL